MRLLFVCTGNLCRSPLAEGLATAWAAEALGPRAAGVRISSAGVEAAVGRAMDQHSAAALTRLGGDPSDLRAKALDADLLVGAELVLTMTRRQRKAVLERNPRGLRRTFTLLEARELLSSADLTGLGDLPLEERAGELGRRLDARRPFRASREADDVGDPIGRKAAVHDEIATVIAEALRPLATVLFTGRPDGALSPDPELDRQS